jgi:hypothetical protein
MPLGHEAPLVFRMKEADVLIAAITGCDAGTASGTAEPTPDQNPADRASEVRGSRSPLREIAVDLAMKPAISGRAPACSSRRVEANPAITPALGLHTRDRVDVSPHALVTARVR